MIGVHLIIDGVLSHSVDEEVGRRAVCRDKDRLKGAVHREAVRELVMETQRLQGSIKP